ncbi:MAG: class I SAM-dependent methyltransferase [Burkholderiales bacterium]|nr:class I SAM-dependent methyltransferase [Burkholderiales bacterium]
MTPQLLELVNQINALGNDWHGAGSVNRQVLLAIARHCSAMGELRHTAETGAGRSTLLFSHLSRDHVVFAVDARGSLAKPRESPLLKPGRVTFIEGPTQKTLPAYPFDRAFQAVLIDGPHAYPFPDIEYFHFYPHLDPGGLLILDDTQIPTIGRMFEILKADAMYELIEVVHTTAFLRRTGAPTHNPYGDEWHRQGYNRPYYESLRADGSPIESRFGPLLRRLSGAVPPAFKERVPEFVKRKLWRRM